MTVASLLLKAKELHRQAVAKQPLDPLVELTNSQRSYYDRWWALFKSANTAAPDAFYAAVIDRKGWTPCDMLDRPKITKDMTLQEAQDVYNAVRDYVR